MSIDLSNATPKIDEINKELKPFALSIVLNYKDNLSGQINHIYSFSKSINKLTLCLIKKAGIDNCNNNSPDAKQQCISSIELDIYEDEDSDQMKILCEISSFTKKSCECRSYNTLLRSILVFIANAIKLGEQHVTTILSIPINNISIWLLVSSYYTSNKYYEKVAGTTNYKSTPVNYTPTDFKEMTASNIFNNAKKVSTRKNNKANVIPSKVNNKNTRKNNKLIERHIHNDINKKNNKYTNENKKEQMKKEIVKNIYEIEIDINPHTENGQKNIAIAKDKIAKFIAKQGEYYTIIPKSEHKIYKNINKPGPETCKYIID